MASQWREKHVPYMMGQHCMVHRTNLVMQTLFNLPIMGKLEDLLHSLYVYFSSSLKRHLEFNKLAKIVEIKIIKILKNVKT
jgi:hypothetical protein